MNRLIFGLGIFVCSLNAVAQECSDFYFMRANKTIEMTIYDRKGKPGAKQVYTVSDVSDSGGTQVATLNSEMFDRKGRSIAKAASNIKCANGRLMVDMKMSLPQQQMAQMKSTDVQADNIYIEYPASMKVGDQLADGNFDMEVDNNGLKQSIKMTISNRKVEGQENITTSAGNWECFKITFTGKATVKTMGIGIPINLDGSEWFAPGFGVVKSESKHGSTEITSIK